MHYRRDQTPAGCWFFTVVTHQRRPLLANAASVDILRQAFREVRKRHPFTIDAIVILPDHLHTLWSLPEGDNDFPTRWMLIKSRFTRSYNPGQPAPRSSSRVHKREQAIWQRRYWEHRIRDPRDYAAHFDYIHYNPVKHGHVSTPSDWPWSSIHRYIRSGLLQPNWASTVQPDIPDTTGQE